jgi:hypothetical protein
LFSSGGLVDQFDWKAISEARISDTLLLVVRLRWANKKAGFMVPTLPRISADCSLPFIFAFPFDHLRV